jgi:hypothetical protein
MQKILFAAILLVSCAHARSPETVATPGGSPSPAAQELAKLKGQVMSADYRADLKELARLRDELAQWPKDRELAYLARYWGGFASWRIALNGANHDMKPEELTKNVENAATSFYFSIQLEDDFADAYAAAASINGWLAKLQMDSNHDMVAVMERVSLAYALLGRATKLEPANPRVLWIKGGFLQFAPGGSLERAIGVYQQMLKEAKQRRVDAASPLPDWGRPEALMSLAYAHFSKTPPDLALAHDEASAALELVPEWSYLRDTLMPQIEQRLRPAQ